MRFQKDTVIPLVIFLFAFALRIALISKGPYHGDTMALIIQAEKTLESFQLHKQSALGFPLIVILASFFIFLFDLLGIGTHALAVNFMSVVFSSFTVVVFYYLCAEFFEHFTRMPRNAQTRDYQRLTAIIGAILLSVSPIFLGISVYGKNHAPCLFFLLLGVWSFLRYQRTGRSLFFYGSALSLGLMGAVRLIDLVLMAAPLSFLWTLFLKNKPAPSGDASGLRLNFAEAGKRFVTWWALIAGCVLLFYLPYFFQGQAGSFLRPLERYIDHALLDNFLGFFSHKLLVTLSFLVKNFTYAGLLLSLGGLVVLFGLNRKITYFLILWIICPVVYYGNLRMTVTSRYFVILLPAIIFCMAFVFAHFRDKALWLKAMAFILLFGIGVSTFIRVYPLLKIRHEKADVPDFVRWFDRMAEPGARIIHGDGSAFFHYYSDRKTAYRPLKTRVFTDEELADFKKRTDALLDKGVPLYITSVGLFSYDYAKKFSNFVFDNYCLEYKGSHHYEDWHGGAMTNRRIPLKTYKIHPLSVKQKRRMNGHPKKNHEEIDFTFMYCDD